MSIDSIKFDYAYNGNGGFKSKPAAKADSKNSSFSENNSEDSEYDIKVKCGSYIVPKSVLDKIRDIGPEDLKKEEETDDTEVKYNYDDVPESVLDKIRDIGPEDLKKEEETDDTEVKYSYDNVPESVLEKIRDIGPEDLKKKNIFERFIDFIKNLF